MQPDNIVLQRQMVRWGGAAVLTDHTNSKLTRYARQRTSEWSIGLHHRARTRQWLHLWCTEWQSRTSERWKQRVNAPSASISGDGMEIASGATKHLVIILSILSMKKIMLYLRWVGQVISLTQHLPREPKLIARNECIRIIPASTDISNARASSLFYSSKERIRPCSLHVTPWGTVGEAAWIL